MNLKKQIRDMLKILKKAIAHHLKAMVPIYGKYIKPWVNIETIKKYPVYAFVIVLLLFMMMYSCNRMSKKPAKEAKSVVAIPVLSKTLDITQSAFGVIKSLHSVSIKPEIEDAKIEQVLLKEGTQVKKGQVILKLNPDTLLLKIKAAEGKYDAAKSAYEREQELFKIGVGAKAKVDETLRDMLVAESELADAKHALNKIEIKSPINGYVGTLKWNIGSIVSKNEDLISIYGIDELMVELKMPEAFYNQVFVGQKLFISSDNILKKVFATTVDSFDVALDNASHTFLVKARIKNEGQLLRPGMFVRVKVLLSQVEDALMVPEAAVVNEDSQTYLFKVENGLAKQSEVEMGQRENDMVHIKEGITKEDMIITTGGKTLIDGQKVKIMTPEELNALFGGMV